MMASSSDLNDHLLQDDLPWPSSLPFAPTLLHQNVGATHHWSQPLMLNCSDEHFTSDELDVLLLSGSAQGHHHSAQVSTIQDLGFQRSSSAIPMLTSQLQVQDDEHHMIKEEEESCNKNNSSCATTTISYNDIVDGAGLPLPLDGVVLPSVNVSRLQKPCPAAAALEMLGGSARLCKTLVSSSVLLHGGMMPLLRSSEHVLPYAHLQGPYSIHNYKGVPAALVSGNAQGIGACHEQPAVTASSKKKPRLEPRSSTTIVPSYKVRKEKLGDRIAALQQLVSPFGKTDTASVLMEAIGYIKFLQDQVETLSGPYMRMKSSKNKRARTTLQQPRGPSSNNGGDERDDELAAAAKVDLRSRGLCLVPLSCTSYVTNENAAVWPPTNFRRN